MVEPHLGFSWLPQGWGELWNCRFLASVKAWVDWVSFRGWKMNRMEDMVEVLTFIFDVSFPPVWCPFDFWSFVYDLMMILRISYIYVYYYYYYTSIIYSYSFLSRICYLDVRFFEWPYNFLIYFCFLFVHLFSLFPWICPQKVVDFSTAPQSSIVPAVPWSTDCFTPFRE